MCFLSHVHFLCVYVSVVLVAPTPHHAAAAAGGMFAVDCLQAPSQTVFGKISVKLVEPETVKTEEETCQFFFSFFYFPVSVDRPVCKLFVVTHSKEPKPDNGADF